MQLPLIAGRGAAKAKAQSETGQDMPGHQGFVLLRFVSHLFQF